MFMSLFKKADSTHPIYGSGSFVLAGASSDGQAVSTARADRAVNDSALQAAQAGDTEKVRLILDQGHPSPRNAEVGQLALALVEEAEVWEVARLLLAIWTASLSLPPSNPSRSKVEQAFLLPLPQPVEAEFLTAFTEDHGQELLNASNDYAGVAQLVLPVENNYRIYLEACHGDRFAHETTSIYAVGREWRKTKIPHVDREVIRFMLEKGCAGELCDSPEEADFDSSGQDYNPYEVELTGSYQHLFRRAYPKKHRR